MAKRDWNTFISSIFFVLGFSLVFSLAGILLQTVLSSIAYAAQLWLTRIGGVIIILFGFYLLGILKIAFLEREHKLNVKKKFKSMYVASFVFGAAFAIGWSPCIGAILGAVLTLAVSNPSTAFILLMAYSLGIGLPFLIVGLFTNEVKYWIAGSGKWLVYLRYIFGVILILLGLLILTNNMWLIANFSFASEFILDVDSSLAGSTLNIAIAFLAGIVSFLSPCILPLIPAYLSFLASIGERKN